MRLRRPRACSPPIWRARSRRLWRRARPSSSANRPSCPVIPSGPTPCSAGWPRAGWPMWPWSWTPRGGRSPSRCSSPAGWARACCASSGSFARSPASATRTSSGWMTTAMWAGTPTLRWSTSRAATSTRRSGAGRACPRPSGGRGSRTRSKTSAEPWPTSTEKGWFIAISSPATSCSTASSAASSPTSASSRSWIPTGTLL